jgi:glycosyltransferase involved in cell wall biosynthesis
MITSTPADRARQDVLYYSDSLDQEAFSVYRDAGIDFERVQRGSVGSPAFVFRLAREIRRRRPDILHCWLPSAVLWARWGGFLARVPHIVLSIRNSNIELWPLLRISHHVGGRNMHYLVNTRAVAAAVATRIGVAPSRISVVENGIEVEPPRSTLARESLLREHGCPPGTRIALTVGRLTANKNYPMLLRIAARCRDRLPVHFFIAGHGEEEHALRDLTSRLGLGDIVHFLGLRHDVPVLLGAADLFCFPSRYEGFPNALLEAMAAARPIVTTRFAGHDEMVEADRTGFIVEQDDDAGAFDAVSRLLADADLATRMGMAARQAAEARFGMGRMVEATLTYYETLMAGAV